MSTTIQKEDILKAAREMSKEARLKLIAEIAALPDESESLKSTTTTATDQPDDFDQEVISAAREFMDKYGNLASSRRMTTRYITIDQIIRIHGELIERFGGSHGIRDMSPLESAVGRYQSGYYADPIEEATLRQIILSQVFSGRIFPAGIEACGTKGPAASPLA